jgi:hypothetical protein
MRIYIPQIDLRRKSQYFKLEHYPKKELYMWKNKYGYDIGVNGTSFHTFLSKEKLTNKKIKEKIIELINNKNIRGV